MFESWNIRSFSLGVRWAGLPEFPPQPLQMRKRPCNETDTWYQKR